MKTVKLGSQVKRMLDADAKVAVEKNGWNYCPKSEWKKLRQKAK